MPSSTSSPLSAFHKKQKMSLTQTYYLAHTARAKLSKEASRGDHNLRLLVGHANLLDGLMIDLVEAERSQEALFNASTRQQSVTFAPAPSRQPTIMEDYEEDSDSDSDSDYEEESTVEITEVDDDMEIDDEEGYEHLALTRTPSHLSPPELLHESDDESDEELPSSPPTPEALSYPESVSDKKTTESIQEAFYEEGFYLPRRSAVAVY